MPPELVELVGERLRANKRVRRSLPLWGRLHIDRQLPFLCVYRRPPVGRDTGTDRLVTGEAAYMCAPGIRSYHAGLRQLLSTVAGAMVDAFGAFLIVEIWAGGPVAEAHSDVEPSPHFRVLTQPDTGGREFGRSIAVFQGALEKIRVGDRSGRVELQSSRLCGPAQLPPLLTTAQSAALSCSFLGIEVPTLYREPATETLYPLMLREFRRKLSHALRPLLYEFARSCTPRKPTHHHMLGRRAIVKAFWSVDEQLHAVSNSFNTLLQVTPTNVGAAWRSFVRSDFQEAPRFRYRPLPADPSELKRRLFNAPVERIEDPSLLGMARETQDDLDRRITLLLDIDTPRFLPGSIALYGGVEDALLHTAQAILQAVPPRAREPKGPVIDGEEFARRAEAELAFLRAQSPGIDTRVELRDDLTGGFMVAQGQLLISRSSRTPESRVAALLQHEVGTHVVTYLNGRAQPLKQLQSGLAGYDEIQEGLAVTAEFLVGGLSRPRLRLIAARVVGVRCLLDGASFVETYRVLTDTHGLPRSTAFGVTMRIYRGGGFTKDAVYLRGLEQVLTYLAAGGDTEPLLVGKIGLQHVGVVRELLYRGVLTPPLVRPRYLVEGPPLERLELLRRGKTVLGLVEPPRPVREPKGESSR